MTEGVPTVDYADRLANNLDTFMAVHRADLGVMMMALDRAVDLILMDMLMAGFEEIKTIAMQSLEEIGDKTYDELREGFAQYLKAQEASE